MTRASIKLLPPSLLTRNSNRSRSNEGGIQCREWMHSYNPTSRLTNGDFIDTLGSVVFLAKVLVEKGRHFFVELNLSFLGLKDMSFVVERDVFRLEAPLLQRCDHSF